MLDSSDTNSNAINNTALYKCYFLTHDVGNYCNHTKDEEVFY